MPGSLNGTSAIRDGHDVLAQVLGTDPEVCGKGVLPQQVPRENRASPLPDRLAVAQPRQDSASRLLQDHARVLKQELIRRCLQEDPSLGATEARRAGRHATHRGADGRVTEAILHQSRWRPARLAVIGEDQKAGFDDAALSAADHCGLGLAIVADAALCDTRVVDGGGAAGRRGCEPDRRVPSRPSIPGGDKVDQG